MSGVAERLAQYGASHVPDVSENAKLDGELVERAATLLAVMPRNQLRKTIEELLSPNDRNAVRRLDALIDALLAIEDETETRAPDRLSRHVPQRPRSGVSGGHTSGVHVRGLRSAGPPRPILSKSAQVTSLPVECSVQPASCSSLYRASVLNEPWSRESFVFSPTRSKGQGDDCLLVVESGSSHTNVYTSLGEARPRETRRRGGTHHLPAAAW